MALGPTVIEYRLPTVCCVENKRRVWGRGRVLGGGGDAREGGCLRGGGEGQKRVKAAQSLQDVKKAAVALKDENEVRSSSSSSSRSGSYSSSRESKTGQLL